MPEQSQGAKAHARAHRTPPGAARAGERDAEGAAPAKGSIKETARDAGARLKRDALGVAENLQSKAAEALQAQREAAAGRIESLADAVRHTAQRITDEDDDALVGQLAEEAAERIHGASEYMRSHELRDVIDDVEDLARRHPLIFCAGAFAAGALLARFLKSSHRRYDREVEEEARLARAQSAAASRQAGAIAPDSSAATADDSAAPRAPFAPRDQEAP